MIIKVINGTNKRIQQNRIISLMLFTIFLFTSCDIFSENEQWSHIGLEGMRVNKLVLSNSNLFACAGNNGLWKLNINNRISQWQYLGLADSSLSEGRGVVDVLVDPDDQSKILVSFDNNNIEAHCLYRTINNGNSWTAADSGLAFYYEGRFQGFNQVRCLLYYPNYILGTGCGAYTSINFGLNWEIAGTLRSEPQSAIMECHPLNPKFVCLGGHDIYYNPVLAISKNGGRTWQNLNNSDLGLAAMYYASVHCFSFDPLDTNIIYMGIGENIMKTNDSGVSWIITSDSLRAKALLNDPNNSSHMWAGIGFELKESFDNGVNWEDIESPINGYVLDIIFEQEQDILFLSTTNGVYRFRQE